MSTMQSVVTVCQVCGDRIVIPVRIGLPTVDSDNPSSARVEVDADMGDLRAHMGSHEASVEVTR